MGLVIERLYPAGAEVWNAMRMMDWLEQRPEVDPNRFAVTGISGGGVMTQYLTAMDERVKVAAASCSTYTIGHGAIIAACSVITKDIPPYAIAAGIPAKVIKYRFTQEQISQLLNIKWWDWEVEKIKQQVHLLSSNRVDEFINQHKK